MASRAEQWVHHAFCKGVSELALRPALMQGQWPQEQLPGSQEQLVGSQEQLPGPQEQLPGSQELLPPRPALMQGQWSQEQPLLQTPARAASFAQGCGSLSFPCAVVFYPFRGADDFSWR